MIDDSGHDARDDGIELSRRRALMGLGGAALLGAGGFSMVRGQSQDGAARERATWTARRRMKYARYSVGRYREEQDLPAREPSEDHAVPIHSADTISTLHYVGADWHPHANPDSDSDETGAWQHTFAVNNVGTAQILARNDFDHLEASSGSGPVLVRGRPPRYKPSATDLSPRFRVQAVNDVEDDNTVDPIAVSARRDRDLFGFVDPATLEEQFALGGDLDPIGDLVARNTGDSRTDFAQVRENFAEARSKNGGGGADVGTVAEGAESSIGLMAELTDENAGKIRALLDDAATVSTASAAVQAANEVREAVVEVFFDHPEPVDGDEVRFFNGFERPLPREQAGPLSGGYVLFDVYVAPGESGEVEIASETSMYLVTGGTGELRQSATWTVRFDGHRSPDVANLSREERCNAEIVDHEFQVYRPMDDEQLEESDINEVDKVEFPYEEPAVEKRPKVPSPGISPPSAIAESDDGSAGVDEGTTVTFDAYDTVLCSGPITGYRWEIFRVDADGTEHRYDSASGTDAVEFTPTIGVPGETGTHRVRVTVRDEHTSDWSWEERPSTSLEFQVGDVVSPEAAISTDWESPTAGTELAFDASGSTTATGAVQSYAWDVTQLPESVADSVENAPDYVYSGSGERFAFTPPQPGTYTVRVSVLDEVRQTDAAEVTFDVGSTAVQSDAAVADSGQAEGLQADGAFGDAGTDLGAAVDAPAAPTVGEPVTLDGSGSTGSVASYDWTVSRDGQRTDPGSGQTIEFAFPEAGSYTVELSVTDASGRSATAAQTVSVAPEPIVDVASPTGPDGDGLYDDVVDLYQHLSDPAATDHASAYDFDGNGDLTFRDVFTLFEDV